MGGLARPVPLATRARPPAQPLAGALPRERVRAQVAGLHARDRVGRRRQPARGVQAAHARRARPDHRQDPPPRDILRASRGSRRVRGTLLSGDASDPVGRGKGTERAKPRGRRGSRPRLLRRHGGPGIFDPRRKPDAPPMGRRPDRHDRDARGQAGARGGDGVRDGLPGDRLRLLAAKTGYGGAGASGNGRPARPAQGDHRQPRRRHRQRRAPDPQGRRADGRTPRAAPAEPGATGAGTGDLVGQIEDSGRRSAAIGAVVAKVFRAGMTTMPNTRTHARGPTGAAALAWVVCGVCVVTVTAFAQEAIDDRAQPARGNPSSLYGRDSSQGVYVRDSAVAVEKFALAERLEHLKEWDKSADVYMEILQGYPDRVVPSQVDKDNKIYQYTSVASAVQERLAKWPREGLEVYRGRYEDDAEALLEQAADEPARLHRVVSLYFVTESAKRAAVRLSDIYLESADFPAAAWLGDRMLGWHPSLSDDERARFLFRAAL